MCIRDRYGDTVRVVDASGWSTEFCGGTHVSNTSQLGCFKKMCIRDRPRGMPMASATTIAMPPMRAETGNFVAIMLDTVRPR